MNNFQQIGTGAQGAVIKYKVLNNRLSPYKNIAGKKFYSSIDNGDHTYLPNLTTEKLTIALDKIAVDVNSKVYELLPISCRPYNITENYRADYYPHKYTPIFIVGPLDNKNIKKHNVDIVFPFIERNKSSNYDNRDEFIQYVIFLFNIICMHSLGYTHKDIHSGNYIIHQSNYFLIDMDFATWDYKKHKYYEFIEFISVFKKLDKFEYILHHDDEVENKRKQFTSLLYIVFFVFKNLYDNDYYIVNTRTETLKCIAYIERYILYHYLELYRETYRDFDKYNDIMDKLKKLIDVKLENISPNNYQILNKYLFSFQKVISTQTQQNISAFKYELIFHYDFQDRWFTKDLKYQVRPVGVSDKSYNTNLNLLFYHLDIDINNVFVDYKMTYNHYFIIYFNYSTELELKPIEFIKNNKNETHYNQYNRNFTTNSNYYNNEGNLANLIKKYGHNYNSNRSNGSNKKSNRSNKSNDTHNVALIGNNSKNGGGYYSIKIINNLDLY